MRLFSHHNRQNVSVHAVAHNAPVIFATRGLSFTTSFGLALTALLSQWGDTMAQTSPLRSTPAQTYAQANEANVSSPAAQQLLFVNPMLGNDAGDGSQRSPFRTLTHALQIAQPNTVIMLALGTYSADTGEVFPLVMKPGVTIQGDPSTKGQGITIRGGGSFLSRTSASQNVTLLGADQAQLVGVTVTNPNPRGYGLWIESSNPVVMSSTFTGSTHDGISTVGNSAPRILNNLFSENGANGITVFGSSRPELRENVFERTGFGINVAEQATPVIIDNRISQNRIGVLVQENARPVLRGNRIESNRDDGVAIIANAQPNLGTATDPGNNTFQNNGQLDINANASSQTIPAFGNQIASDRTNGKIDLTGTVALTPIPGTANPPVANTPTTTSTPIASTAQTETSQASQSPSEASTQTQARSQTQLQGQSQILRSAPSQVYQAATGAITELPPPITTPPPGQNTAQPTAQNLSQPSHTTTVTRARAASVIPASQAIVTPPPTHTANSTNATAAMHLATAPRTATPSPSLPTTAMVPAAAPIAVPPPIPVQPPVTPVSQTPVSQVSASPAPSTTATAINIPVPPPAQPQQGTRSTANRSATSTASTRANSTARTSRTTNSQSTGTSAGQVSNRQTLAYAAPATFTAPIEIPVPPPESSQVPPAQVMNRVPTPPVVPSTATQSNLLPVPGEDIPIGNVGDLPTVAVSRNPSVRADSRTGGTSRRANLRYRVVVSASSERTQSLVQSIVPSAFLTSINGQELIQVGAFSTRDNAEQAVQMLNQSGFDAIIQEIN